ncbi:MAG: aldo/keto reductase [Rubrivivax sp. SCN 71-131]|nr:MAG: aldo/keto reductase [Rubrivivax sp. SCN 71-131]
MSQRTLAGRDVKPIGLGCMNLSHAYGAPPTAAQGQALLQRALELGVDCFDTAALYGGGANEELVGRALAPVRDRITLCSKGGLVMQPQADGTRKRVIDGRPEALRSHVEQSLARLRTERIDLYFLHRLDPKVPVEDSVGELGRLVAAGKLGAIGLSEVSAATLRRAHAVHPIAALQTEYSLWTRNPEIAVLAACRELGAAFVAFSPLARAFLTNTLHDVSALPGKDIRRGMPRFAPAAYAANLELLPPFVALAGEVGCTPAQLALAWVLAQGEHIIAIPGTTDPAHLQENMGALQVRLEAGHLRRLDAMIDPARVVGPRYSAAAQADIDTEVFADGR